jgi:hypothetical protein
MTARRLRRLLAEAGFIVAVAVLAWVADLSTVGLVAAVLVAWLLAACAEILGSRTEGREPGGEQETAPPARAIAAARSVVLPHRRQVAVAGAQILAQTHPEDNGVTVLHAAAFRFGRSRRHKAEVAVGEDAPGARDGPPRTRAEPSVAVPTERPAERQARRWNLWELERLARDPGLEPMRELELSALLVHLRDYAGADGMLPTEFDPLVRESFGDLLAAGS